MQGVLSDFRNKKDARFAIRYLYLFQSIFPAEKEMMFEWKNLRFLALDRWTQKLKQTTVCAVPKYLLRSKAYVSGPWDLHHMYTDYKTIDHALLQFH